MAKGKRKPSKPADIWTLDAKAPSSGFACLHVDLDLKREKAGVSLLGLHTHFKPSVHQLGLFGKFEISLKRCEILVQPTNFKAHADGFISTELAERSTSANVTKSSTKQGAGGKLTIAPEVKTGAEGGSAKLGSLELSKPGNTDSAQISRVVKTAHVNISPGVNNVIEARYREPNGETPLSSLFKDKVRGDAKEDREVRFKVSAEIDPSDYIVKRRKGGVDVSEGRATIMRSIVLFNAKNQAKFKGPYEADVSGAYGQPKNR